MIRFPSRRALRNHALSCTVAAVSTALLPGVPLMLIGAPYARSQAVYPSPDAAANALTDALASNDQDALKHVLGNDFKHFIPVQGIGEDDIYDYLGAWAKGHQIVDDSNWVHGMQSVHLEVGESNWTLPIPIVKSKQGWHFDPPAATDEILTRRIGRNERAAMLTSLAYLDAQNDYHTLTQHYAQHFVSTPGTHDGLYWPVAPSEQESPLGPLAATMPHNSNVAKDGYHGYHFRILTAQGKNAKGGERNYVQGGEMTQGFGLVAWPAEYGKSGVMSFMVNQEGEIYQKDLGPRSSQMAAALKSFNPDPSWQLVEP
jgi:Protein of unknown function (DUF2950)